MAAITGAFFFDLRSAGDAIAGLRDGMRTMALDAREVCSNAGIAMMQADDGIWTNEIETPSNPTTTERSIAFDGRIDNRDDLLLQLQGTLRPGSDASIAMDAFERWGVDGLGRLVGDWSLAIWCSGTLHLARDYMGTRPLYYAAGPRSVMWSSHLGELARRSGRADALSEDFIASCIVQEISPEITPYHGVRAVPPGTCLSYSVDRVERRRRFWTFGTSVVRFRRQEDYEEAFRELWSQAVRVRLRTTQPVWAELSGGLDSSAVVCTAKAMMRAERVPAGSLRLISHATLASAEGDERRFIAEIERHVGVESDVFGVEEHRTLVDDEWDWVSPFATRGVLLACLRHVQRSGGRFVLSGRMGDAVTGCQPDNSLAVFDDLQSDGALAALSNMRRWCRATKQPFAQTGWRLLRWLAANPPLDPSASATPASDLSASPTAPGSLLTPRLRRGAMGCRAAGDDLRSVRPSKRWLARMLLGYARTSRLDLPLHPPGIVYTYPFAHRPLVEFMLAIPGGIVTAPGETRSLMRRALAGLVPPRVLQRHSKGYYPPALLRTLRPAATELLPVRRLEIVRRGWIDPSALETAIRGLIDAGIARADLRRAIRLEEWLASRERQGTFATPRRKEVKNHGVHHA